jgi:hypothetical protein
LSAEQSEGSGTGCEYSEWEIMWTSSPSTLLLHGRNKRCSKADAEPMAKSIGHGSDSDHANQIIRAKRRYFQRRQQQRMPDELEPGDIWRLGPGIVDSGLGNDA